MSGDTECFASDIFKIYTMPDPIKTGNAYVEANFREMRSQKGLLQSRDS